jgi:hypothetical protein
VWSRPFAQSGFGLQFLGEPGATGGINRPLAVLRWSRAQQFPSPWRCITCSTSLLAASNAALSRRWDAAVNELPASSRCCRHPSGKSSAGPFPGPGNVGPPRSYHGVGNPQHPTLHPSPLAASFGVVSCAACQCCERPHRSVWPSPRDGDSPQQWRPWLGALATIQTLRGRFAGATYRKSTAVSLS